jgi:hypothetical protein
MVADQEEGESSGVNNQRQSTLTPLRNKQPAGKHETPAVDEDEYSQ